MKLGLKNRKAELSNTYAVKDSLDEIYLSDYIRIVFDDDLSVLVKTGKVPEKALIEAKNRVLFEFTTASGGEKINPLLNSTRKIFLIKSRIALLTLCQNLISAGKYEKPKEYLKQMRIRFDEKNIKSSLSLLGSKIKELVGRLNHEIKQYNDKLPKDETDKFTRDDLEKQIAFVSKWIGFRIEKEKTTLREYASYLSNIKQESQKQQENGNAGKFRIGSPRGT